MKQLVTSYAISGADVTINAPFGFTKEAILVITDVTTHTMRYCFNDSALGGSLSGNVLTLDNITGLTDSNQLQIWIDDGFGAATENTLGSLLGSSSQAVGLAQTTDNTLAELRDAVGLLKRIAKALDSLQTVDTAQRQRVTIDAGTLPTVTTVTTCNAVGGVTTVAGVTAVTTLNALGSVPTIFPITDIARQAYATGIRARLTF